MKKLSLVLMLVLIVIGQVAAQSQPVVGSSLETARFPEVVSGLSADLERLSSDRIGYVFTYVNADGTEEFSVSSNTEKLFPMASVFKMWVAASYYYHVPREQWQDGEGTPLYRMLVASNNTLTGQVLVDTAKAVGADNPIVLFNDFLRDVIGLENTGIYSWAYPGTPSAGYVDERFNLGQVTDPQGKSVFISNMISTEQAHRGLMFLVNREHHPLWESSPSFKLGMTNLVRILGIQHPTYRSLVERRMYDFSWGKDGTLQPGDIPGSNSRVNNDLKVIPRGRGNYVLSIFGWGAEEVHLDPVVDRMIQTIQQYESLIDPATALAFSEPSEPIRMGEYNYGWVKSDQIGLYFAPDENAEQYPNFVRQGRISITWYVMQGAMLRVFPVNEVWGEVIGNDMWDETYSYGGQSRKVYVKFSDLQMVGPEHFSPIGYLSGQPSGTPKNIFIDVPNRTLTLMEGEIAVFKTPIVLNAEKPEWPESTFGTPRERSYVGKHTISRNMPNYPGVGYSALLVGLRSDGTDIQNTGYYLHSSPWQRWETMTKSEVLRRRSSGCVNIPSWIIDVPGVGPIRPDELIFRWTGGNPDAGETILYYQPGEVARVFVIDTWTEVVEGSIARTLRSQGLNPGVVYENWMAAPEAAPSYFFNQ